ncbi:MAG: peptide chain release factor N(5)-glutamine methyltransferase [Clostridia bacterium]|nr:peptide chain release factor N(5)-glutamine methyltransferase [Clostridia bacterium]
MEFLKFYNNLIKEYNTIPKREINWAICWLLNKKNLIEITKITEEEKNKIINICNELNLGKPLAYVINNAEFFNYSFFVNENVLIPRFETELLVEKVINYAKNLNKPKILDLCSGSGCIAISLAKSLNLTVDAVEISDKAIEVITKNAKLNNANINIIKSDLFNNVNKKYDIIVSNPPYIASNEIKSLQSSVKEYEPHLALDGGIDGLDFYKKIALKAPDFLNKNGQLFLEIGYDQEKTVPEILSKNFENIQVFNDYSNLPRMIVAKKKEILK